MCLRTGSVTLAAAGICTIEIAFEPTAIGDFSDQIIITSNAVSSPDTVNLRGRSILEPLVVPTLNVWGLLVMTLLILLISQRLLRKRVEA